MERPDRPQDLLRLPRRRRPPRRLERRQRSRHRDLRTRRRRPHQREGALRGQRRPALRGHEDPHERAAPAGLRHVGLSDVDGLGVVPDLAGQHDAPDRARGYGQPRPVCHSQPHQRHEGHLHQEDGSRLDQLQRRQPRRSADHLLEHGSQRSDVVQGRANGGHEHPGGRQLRQLRYVLSRLRNARIAGGDTDSHGTHADQRPCRDRRDHRREQLHRHHGSGFPEQSGRQLHGTVRHPARGHGAGGRRYRVRLDHERHRHGHRLQSRIRGRAGSQDRQRGTDERDSSGPR